MGGTNCVCEGSSNERFRRALEEMESYTLEELERTLGPLTDEEKQILSNPALFNDPTPEELAALGPDFVERIIAKVKARLRERGEIQ